MQSCAPVKTTLATIGQLTCIGECYANYPEPPYPTQWVKLKIKSSANHAAYADLTQEGAGTTNGSGDMVAGTEYPLAGTMQIPAQVVFTPVTGEGLSADGHEVFYNLYMGQNVGGVPPGAAGFGRCVFGGSLVVR